MKDSEEKIALYATPPEVYFVVDCPSLHIIPLNRIGPRRDSQATSTGLSEFERNPSFCPACGQRTTKTRQIPSLCLGSEASAAQDITLTPPLPLDRLTPSPSPESQYSRPPRYDRKISDPVSLSQASTLDEIFLTTSRPEPSSLPEAVSFLEVIDRDLVDPRPSRTPTFGTVQKAATHPAPQRGVFNLKWPGKGAKERRQSKPKSTHSEESSGSTLPKFLSFAFSNTGRNLLIWKKDSESIVRIELENGGGRLIDLGGLLPGGADGDKSVNIRFVAEGNEWISAILSHNISHNRALSLLLVHSSGLAEHSSIHPLEAQIEPRCLAISPDNQFVAAGFGTKVLLINYQGCHQQWHRVLHIPDLTQGATARFQALSFSSDSSCLTVSTQKRDAHRSDQDDVVYTHVWRCEPIPNLSTQLSQCIMPTDGQGLTTVNFHPTLSMGIITGMTPTPYPLFIVPATQKPPPTPTNINDFRIRSCCTGHPPNSNIAYYLDVRNRIFRVDLHAQSIRQIADLNTTRGSLKPQEEPAVMSVTEDGQLRIFWRQGPGLWCVEVRERLAPEKINLRSIWQDAVGE